MFSPLKINLAVPKTLYFLCILPYSAGQAIACEIIQPNAGLLIKIHFR